VTISIQFYITIRQKPAKRKAFVRRSFRYDGS